MRNRYIKWQIVVLLLLLVGCTWPQDPKGTTDAVRDQVMVVGVAENKPWVTRAGDTPGGIEVELVQQFARTMNADVEWEWGSMAEHLEALNQYELDLVIGGLISSSPGSIEVGLTQPFYEEHIIVGVPAGIPVPQAIDDMPVDVVRGTAVSDYVRSAGGEPVLLSSPQEINGATAVPAWQADEWQLQATGITLHERHHVMAVPPGENQWLTELETFLQNQPPVNP